MSSARRLFLKILVLSSLLVPLFFSGCAEDDAEELRPPDITLDALDPSRFESQKQLSGTVDQNASVTVSVNTSAEVGEVVVEDGLWRTSITDLQPGLNWVTVSAEDDFNTRTLQFEIVYSIVQIDQIRTVTAAQDTTIYGQLVQGGSIESVLLNGTELDLAYPLTTNPWSLDIANLQEGANTVEIEALGPDGQFQELVSTITRTLAAVPMTIDPLPQPPNLTMDSLTLTGTNIDRTTVEQLVVDVGGANVEEGDVVIEYPTDTTWSATIENLREGSSLLSVSASAEDFSAASGTVRVSVETDPLVDSMDPADGETGVALDTVVSAVFNQAVVGSSVNGESFSLFDGAMNAVGGTATYDAEQTRAVFTPAVPLTPSTIYTAELTGDIVDAEGNPIPATSWDFTTVAE